MKFTKVVEDEYRDLANSCVIEDNKIERIDGLLDKMEAEPLYRDLQTFLGVPWWFTAIVHQMESGGNFKTHLHNGDPLTDRTRNVPTGRPAKGVPPFTWFESAADALTMKGLDRCACWTVPGTLYQFERFNGFGYRAHGIHSPYLWSWTNHYTLGKYVSDGRYDPAAVSRQCGAAAYFIRLLQTGLDIEKFPKRKAPPILLTHSWSKEAEDLQKWLNTFPGIYLRVDGRPGPKTADAFRKVTGRPLWGAEEDED